MSDDLCFIKMEEYEEPIQESYEVNVMLRLPTIRVVESSPERAYDFAMFLLNKKCEGIFELYKDFEIDDEIIDVDERGSNFTDRVLDIEIDFTEKSEKLRS